MSIDNPESILQSELSGGFERQMFMADLFRCPWQSELPTGNLKGFVPEWTRVRRFAFISVR